MPTIDNLPPPDSAPTPSESTPQPTSVSTPASTVASGSLPSETPQIAAISQVHAITPFSQPIPGTNVVVVSFTAKDKEPLPPPSKDETGLLGKLGVAWEQLRALTLQDWKCIALYATAIALLLLCICAVAGAGALGELGNISDSFPLSWQYPIALGACFLGGLTVVLWINEDEKYDSTFI